MANYTVSGTGYLPDGITMLDGYWSVALVTSNGAVLEDDGDWRGSILTVRAVGPTTITLPETVGEESYAFSFRSKDRSYALGPFHHTLEENINWADLIDTPAGVPVNPSALSQISQLLADAEEPTDVLVAALIANAASLVRDQLDNFFLLKSGTAKLTVSNIAPASPAVGDVWIDIS